MAYNMMEYMQGVAMRNNPQLLKEYLASIQAENAGAAARKGYGSAGLQQQSTQVNMPMEGPMQPGQQRPNMNVNQIVQEATPGSGLIGRAMNAGNQREADYLQMQKDMTYGGIGGMAQQAALLKNMQDNIMRGNTGAPKSDATTTMKNYAFAQRTPGFDAWNRANKRSGAMNMGTNAQPRWMTKDAKASQGIPQDKNIWLDAKGAPHEIATRTDADKKAVVALDQMEDATSTLNTVLSEYEPEKLQNLAAKNIPGIPESARNYLRDAIAKTVNSAKKSWAENVLRDATGAVINNDEYDNYDVIFMPTAFDLLADKERKAKLRYKKENAWRRRVGQKEKEYVSPYGKEDSLQTLIKSKKRMLTREEWQEAKKRGLL